MLPLRCLSLSCSTSLPCDPGSSVVPVAVLVHEDNEKGPSVGDGNVKEPRGVLVKDIWVGREGSLQIFTPIKGFRERVERRRRPRSRLP